MLDNVGVCIYVASVPGPPIGYDVAVVVIVIANGVVAVGGVVDVVVVGVVIVAIVVVVSVAIDAIVFLLLVQMVQVVSVLSPSRNGRFLLQYVRRCLPVC